MSTPNSSKDPLIAEDLLLLLFDPRSGTIAGEGTLFYVLGGAVLTELAITNQIAIENRGGLHGSLVSAVEDTPPTDPLLRSAWDRIAEKPRDPQTLLASIGPTLRPVVLDRLVERGYIVAERKKRLRLFTTTSLREGDGRRRSDLLAQVRAVFVDGVSPQPRIAALGALLSASGTLPTFYRDIPWSGDVYTRGKELERGEWGADAVGVAVARTVAASVVNSMVAVGLIKG